MAAAMNAEQRLKDAVKRIHERGEYPGPTVINRELGRTERRMNQLNGKETRWRREAMKELGIELQRPGGVHMHETMYGDYESGGYW